MLEWAAIRLMQGAQYYWPLTADGQPKVRSVLVVDRAGRPVLDKDGKPTFRETPVGDMDKFMELTNALSLTAFRLARFQSPTLQAIAVAQQQSATSDEPIQYEVHIHNAAGDHIKTTIDGSSSSAGSADASRKRRRGRGDGEGNGRRQRSRGQGNGVGLHRGAMAKATAHRGSVTWPGAKTQAGSASR
jgi:hypothetical protein